MHDEVRYYPEFQAKHNTAGPNDPESLLDQGDFPSNVEDLKKRSDEEYEQGGMEMYPGYRDDSAAQLEADTALLEDGVGFRKGMYPRREVRKTSDY